MVVPESTTPRWTLISCVLALAFVLGRSGRGEDERKVLASVVNSFNVVNSSGLATARENFTGDHFHTPRHRKTGEKKEVPPVASPADGIRNVRAHIAAMTSHGHLLGDRHAVHHNKSDAGERGPEQRLPKHPGFSGRLPATGLTNTQIELDDDELVASVDDNSTNLSEKDMLMDLGGGTGATIGGTGNLELDQDLVRRMRYQDKAVMILLLVMYFLVLAFSASFSYRQSLNDSPVTFYADPRYHDLVAEGDDTEAFLEAFNQSPKDVQLQVTGFVPVPAGGLGSIEWQGEYYYDAFSFALDLSPWVVQDISDGSSSNSDGMDLRDGVVAEDLQDLHNYVTRNRNDLAIVDLRKEVSWKSWEELATNIKTRIRQCGFNGIISIHRTECDSVMIYKNTPWANFMHSRTTKVLCALSVLGWIFYLPYMYFRCTCTVIRSRYKVDIPIDNYWSLIADKLTVDGFVEDPNAVRRQPVVNLRAGTGGVSGLPIEDAVRAGVHGRTSGGMHIYGGFPEGVDWNNIHVNGWSDFPLH
jgi:hypothetical protein